MNNTSTSASPRSLIARVAAGVAALYLAGITVLALHRSGVLSAPGWSYLGGVPAVVCCLAALILVYSLAATTPS